jgi:hypothetical protein
MELLRQASGERTGLAASRDWMIRLAMDAGEQLRRGRESARQARPDEAA